MTRPRSDPDPTQLDLFASDDGSPAAGAALATTPLEDAAGTAERPDRGGAAAPPAPRCSPPDAPDAPDVHDAHDATEAPARPLAERPAFRHPQADREIRLQGHLVGYALRRARRRSIGMVVGLEGLTVSAPRWVGVGAIEAALHEKASWIVRKLDEQRRRAERMQAARVDWRDGVAIPFLGEPVLVVLDARVVSALLDAGETAPQAPLAGVPRRMLRVPLPHDAQPAQIRDAVQGWLQRQARRVFAQRLDLFAARIGVRWTRLALSSAQTRWGSASADGVIRLNWRLVHLAMSTIDYVVAHELAHLREMNHSPRFWDVVRSVLPDYEQVRGRLRREVLPDLG